MQAISTRLKWTGINKRKLNLQNMYLFAMRDTKICENPYQSQSLSIWQHLKFSDSDEMTFDWQFGCPAKVNQRQILQVRSCFHGRKVPELNL